MSVNNSPLPLQPPQPDQQFPPAIVATGNVSVPAEPNNQGKLQSTPTLTPDYEIHNRYEGDRDIWMMGITSPNGFQNDTVAFVQLATKTLLWICDWTALARNQPPLLPDASVKDTNWVLLDDGYETMNIDVVLDGETPLYRVSGTYVYGCRRPNARTTRDVQFGRPPWLMDTFNRTIPDSVLQQGLSSMSSQTAVAQTSLSAASPGVP